jgi:hypothetical protein
MCSTVREDYEKAAYCYSQYSGRREFKLLSPKSTQLACNISLVTDDILSSSFSEFDVQWTGLSHDEIAVVFKLQSVTCRPSKVVHFRGLFKISKLLSTKMPKAKQFSLKEKTKLCVGQQPEQQQRKSLQDWAVASPQCTRILHL